MKVFLLIIIVMISNKVKEIKKYKKIKKIKKYKNKYQVNLDEITIKNDFDLLENKFNKTEFKRDEIVNIYAEIYTKRNIEDILKIWDNYINQKNLEKKRDSNDLYLYKSIRHFFYKLKKKTFNLEELKDYLKNNQLRKFIDKFITDLVKKITDKSINKEKILKSVEL